MSFLTARPYAAGSAADVVLLGAPYDETATFRRGAAHAPAAIRWASESLETYSPFQQRDLADLALADAGDLDLAGCTPEAAVDRVRAALADLSGLPVLLGGEHTVTVGAVTALQARHPDLAVIALDAHLDLRDAYDGRRWSHATTLRRIADLVGLDRIAVLGARSGTADEWTLAARLAACSRTGDLETAVWQRLASRPLYLSVDVDALDPVHAPGTGNPEPLGLAPDDLLTLFAVLRDARVVGADLVEISPPYDPTGRTAVLAAWVVRELILALVP